MPKRKLLSPPFRLQPVHIPSSQSQAPTGQIRLDVERWKSECQEGQTGINEGAAVPRLKKGQSGLGQAGIYFHVSLWLYVLPDLLYMPTVLSVLGQGSHKHAFSQGLHFWQCLCPCDPWWHCQHRLFAALSRSTASRRHTALDGQRNPEVYSGLLWEIDIFCCQLGRLLDLPPGPT